MVSIRHFHGLFMHSVVMDFRLFVLLDITLYGLFLGLHSLDIGELGKICKRLLVRWAHAILRIPDFDSPGLSFLRSAPFPMLLVLHEFPLRSDTLLLKLSMLCLAFIFLDALLNL